MTTSTSTPTQTAATQTVLLLDAHTVSMSDLPNRDEASLGDSAFYELQEQIKNMGGNLEPIKVRLAGPVDGVDASPRYEVVFGHRRLRACKNLRLPVRAILEERVSDRQVVIERVVENTAHAPFTAIELGRICCHALDSKQFANQRDLASAIGIDPGQMSKAMTLASLPAEVVAAFESPAHVQYRHATPLREAVERDRDALIAAATEIQKTHPRPSSAEVFTRLISSGGPAIEPFKESVTPLRVGGIDVGELRLKGGRRLLVSLRSELPVDRFSAVQNAIEQALSGKARARRKPSRSGEGTNGVR